MVTVEGDLLGVVVTTALSLPVNHAGAVDGRWKSLVASMTVAEEEDLPGVVVATSLVNTGAGWRLVVVAAAGNVGSHTVDSTLVLPVVIIAVDE